jgi:hypothetical protein
MSAEVFCTTLTIWRKVPGLTDPAEEGDSDKLDVGVRLATGGRLVRKVLVTHGLYEDVEAMLRDRAADVDPRMVALSEGVGLSDDEALSVTLREGTRLKEGRCVPLMEYSGLAVAPRD